MRIAIPKSIVQRVARDLAVRRANGLPVPRAYLVHPSAFTEPDAEPQRDPRPDQLAAAIKRAHDDAILYGHTGYPGDATDGHRVVGKPW